MAQSRRVLVVASALAPFTDLSPTGSLVRSLSAEIQDKGNFEARIMMPCYSCIDEREYNLHEVIRLSGTDVPLGAETESVTVKVASAPDVQLQVYFMDHDTYFDRDAEVTKADGTPYEDNALRSLFFNRSVLEIIRKLRWSPDLVHSFGWISGFLPPLLSTNYSSDDLFSATKSIFTPGDQNPDTSIPSSFADSMGLSLDGTLGSTLPELGVNFADATIFPPDGSPSDGSLQFSEDAGARADELVALYEQMLGEVPA